MWRLLNIRLTNQQNRSRTTFSLRLVYGKGEKLMNRYTLSHGLAVPDAMIAATAKEHQVSFYTLNRKDFRYIEGISLYESNIKSQN